jgi:hypothetical protein
MKMTTIDGRLRNRHYNCTDRLTTMLLDNLAEKEDRDETCHCFARAAFYLRALWQRQRAVNDRSLEFESEHNVALAIELQLLIYPMEL